MEADSKKRKSKSSRSSHAGATAAAPEEKGRRHHKHRHSPAATDAEQAQSAQTSAPSALQLQLLEYKARAQEFVDAQVLRAKTDKVFRQRLQLCALVFIALLFILYQFRRVHYKRSKLTPVSRSSSSSALGDGEDGDSSSASSADINADKAMQTLMQVKSKLSYENEEPGFDVSGNSLIAVRRRFGTREENEAAQQSSPKLRQVKDKKCLRFPSTMKRDGKRYYMPKKVFDLPVLQRSLKRLGFEETDDVKQADLALKGVPRLTFRQLREGKTYYDMVASLSRIGSKKKTQLATLRNYVKKFGCSFEALGIQPRSWDMNKPSDCRSFFDTFKEDKGRMIVFKSCNSGEGSKGLGIVVTDDLAEYREKYSTCEQNAFNHVAQMYIEHPMLIKNRKFDMRVYILVANTQPYIVFFNPGYVRRSLAEYKPNSTEKDDVLTNYHVQVTRSDFKPEDALWSFKEFVTYMQEEKMCRACGDVEIQLSKIARLVFDAGREYYVRHAGSFQLAGLDFMMDSSLRPMFIEGNVSPGLGSHELKWKKELMDDLITIMYEQVMLTHETPDEFKLEPGDRVYGKHGNYWQLLVHEGLDQCEKQFQFNPCKELNTAWKPWLG